MSMNREQPQMFPHLDGVQQVAAQDGWEHHFKGFTPDWDAEDATEEYVEFYEMGRKRAADWEVQQRRFGDGSYVRLGLAGWGWCRVGGLPFVGASCRSGVRVCKAGFGWFGWAGMPGRRSVPV